MRTVFEIADSCARGLSGPKPASTLFRTVDDLWNASQRAFQKRKKERKKERKEETLERKNGEEGREGQKEGDLYTLSTEFDAAIFPSSGEINIVQRNERAEQHSERALSRPLKYRVPNEHLHVCRPNLFFPFFNVYPHNTVC